MQYRVVCPKIIYVKNYCTKYFRHEIFATLSSYAGVGPETKVPYDLDWPTVNRMCAVYKDKYGTPVTMGQTCLQQ